MTGHKLGTYVLPLPDMRYELELQILLEQTVLPKLGDAKAKSDHQ